MAIYVLNVFDHRSIIESGRARTSIGRGKDKLEIFEKTREMKDAVHLPDFDVLVGGFHNFRNVFRRVRNVVP